jgi:hypothetical protein
MATTIFLWIYLFRHKPFVCGINLWQQLSKRGEKLLQHTRFGGDRQVSQRPKSVWWEAIATIQPFRGESIIPTNMNFVASNGYHNG